MNFRMSSMLVGGVLGAAATLYWYKKRPTAVAVAATVMTDMCSSVMGKTKAKMNASSNKPAEASSNKPAEEKEHHMSKSDAFKELLDDKTIIKEMSNMNH